MYEVEYKVEITEDEMKNLVFILKKDRFEAGEIVLQNNYFIEAQKSPIGGYDFKRYREENDKAFYTEKVWENYNGEKIRKEVEKEVPKNILQSEILKYPNILKITKTRQSFGGIYKNKKIHIDMDSVKFIHSTNIRYFIEAEILTENKSEIEIIREFLIEFLKNTLGKSELVEAPGMFNITFEKL